LTIDVGCESSGARKCIGEVAYFLSFTTKYSDFLNLVGIELLETAHCSPHTKYTVYCVGNAYYNQEVIMANGTVKWFNGTKGYGFIQPDEGGQDVFVHISALEKAGLRTLNEGQRVGYELATNKGKTSAVNLKIADAA
jgi:CspA family cold shock protein